MAVIVVILLAVSAILAAVAAYNPPAPPRYNLLSLSIAFLALALLVERWPGG